MRLLVVGDIHSNWAALQSIQEPFDACVCVGDIVDYGPEPEPCIDWVRENALYCVRGNHDHGVAQEVDVHGAAGFRYLTAVTRPLTCAAISPAQRRFLAELPTRCRFTIAGQRYYMVHATPRDPMDEYARPDPEFWRSRLQGIHADFVLVGHTHQPYVLQVNGTTIVNPGSVGLSRDGDPRASYAIIEDGQVRLCRIEYPIGATLTRLEERLADPLARAMLATVYQRGAMLKTAVNGPASAAAAGPANGAVHPAAAGPANGTLGAVAAPDHREGAERTFDA